MNWLKDKGTRIVNGENITRNSKVVILALLFIIET